MTSSCSVEPSMGRLTLKDQRACTEQFASAVYHKDESYDAGTSDDDQRNSRVIITGADKQGSNDRPCVWIGSSNSLVIHRK